MTMDLKFHNRAVNKVHSNTGCLRWLKQCVLSVLPGICYLQPMSLVAEGQLVGQKIYYRMPEASEVFLVWGINGWQTVPEVIRPPETVIKDKVMHTLMNCKCDTFYIRVKVPSGVTIDYGFFVTKLKEGVSIKEIWDGDYHKTPSEEGVIVKPSDMKSTVIQEICYHIHDAEEVDLVWGINGWKVIPEDMRPTNTFIENNVMHTPMVQKDDIFFTKINVIKGTTIDFCFLIKSIQDSIYKKLLLDVGYHLIVSQDTTIHVTYDIIKQKKRHIFNGLKLGFKLLIGAIIVGGICFIIFRFVRVPLQVKKVLLIIMINGVVFIFIIFAGETYFRLRGFQTYVRMFSNQYHENSVGAFWAQVDTSLGWITRKDYPDVNPQGFRDIKDFNNMVNHSKNNRVMILGDSFMWGSGVKTHENVPSLLQTRLQDKYYFYNISVGGWGIDQMYLAYQKYKDVIKPNIVILAYIDDDINRVLECYRQADNLAKPCFSVQADTLAPGKPGSSLQLLLNKIQKECVLFSLIMHHYYLRTDAIPITKRLFSNMIKETKLRNEKFVVIRIPTSDNARSLHLSQYIYDVEEVFRGTEATYLEPLQEIAKIPNWALSLYLYDGHLSVKGNQFLVDYICRHVFKINNLLLLH